MALSVVISRVSAVIAKVALRYERLAGTEIAMDAKADARFDGERQCR